MSQPQELPRGALPLLVPERLRHVTGEASRWQLKDGVLEIAPGTGDVYADVASAAFHLHAEFWLPLMPHAHGQERANSGVYVDGRFEIQLLDSAGTPPGLDTCGALYRTKQPDHDAAGKPEAWQTLDVAYRRRDAGAHLSVLLNGILIHNDVHVERPTPAALGDDVSTIVLLQDHGARVRFRNLWVLQSQ